MNGVAAGRGAGGDERGNVQVALGRGAAARWDGVVGQADVEGVAVGRRVDGDRLDAELAAGADDADGDLAAVGDQDALNTGALAASRRQRARDTAARPVFAEVRSKPGWRTAAAPGAILVRKGH